jgi:hypothetical protein
LYFVDTSVNTDTLKRLLRWCIRIQCYYVSVASNTARQLILVKISNNTCSIVQAHWCIILATVVSALTLPCTVASNDSTLSASNFKHCLNRAYYTKNAPQRIIDNTHTALRLAAVLFLLEATVSTHAVHAS